MKTGLAQSFMQNTVPTLTSFHFSRVADDSPSAGRGRPDARRGTLTRHPSDPLPSDACMSGTFYSMHTAGPLPPGQYPPGRYPDALETTRGPMQPRGRSPTSAYETEYGPVSAPPAMSGSAKWRSKFHQFCSIHLAFRN